MVLGFRGEAEREVKLSTCGYCGRVLHVNLTTQEIEIETPSEAFYRKYLGGSAMGTYYLLKLSLIHI